MSMSEENEAVVRRIFKEIWEDGDLDAVDELVAEDYVMHDSSMPEEPQTGREAFRRMAESGSGVVDGPMEVEQLISTDEYVVVRWRQTGTHVGKMGKVEPSNEEVTITGIEIARLEDGLLAETWDEMNVLPLLSKSGAISADLLSPEMAADD